MLIEMHCHTSRHSACSIIDPVTMVNQVMNRRLQGMVLTEHHYLWTPREISRLKEEAETPDFFLILSGQEVGTDMGHVLVYGADRTIGEEMSLKKLRSAFPHAALVWAHPLRYGKKPDKRSLTHSMLDGVEIFNTNHSPLENYHALKLWHEHKFTAISGSDAHAQNTAGMLPTLFDHPVETMEDLVTEIKKGRCRPFYKEIPKTGGNIVASEIILGTKGERESRSRILLKTATRRRKWRKIMESSQVIRFIHDSGFSGGRFRVPRIIEQNSEEMLSIEEGQRGGSLFDLMKQVGPSSGDTYFRLAAQWLARLHSRNIRIGSVESAKKRERQRFRSYLKAFKSTNSPYMDKAEKLIKGIKEYEEHLFASDSENFTQIHGDYHPKNIIIGQDRMHDINTLFISVIDFGNTLVFAPAFDVGYFISQFNYQFRHFPHLLERHTARAFIKSYREASEGIDRKRFEQAVNFFRIRANLSIGAYLIKVGKGESPDMESLFSQSLVLLEMLNKNR